MARPDAVAKRIVFGVDRGKAVLYAPAFWALIMMISRSIPQSVFKRLRL